jgi:raffinose synthase
VTCYASPKDIEWCNGKTPMCIKDVDAFAVYFFKEKKLKLMKCSDKLEVSLEPFSFELMTVSPVRVFSKRLIQYAPIGLVNMLNSGGAIQSHEFDDHENLVKFGVRGCGEMSVFVSEKPVCCKIDGVAVKFDYEDKMVKVQISWPSSSTLSLVEFVF